MEKRYDGLDGIRTLACIGVILSHVKLNTDYQITDFWFQSMVYSFGYLVCLFMTISGFGMCCGYYKRILNNEIDLRDFYKKRFLKIWPFFALVCVLDFIASPSKEALVELFADLTMFFGFIPNADIHVIGVGWFLGILFAFYFMFPFIVTLLSNKKIAWFAFIISIIFNLCGVYYFNVDKKTIPYELMFFISGGIVYLYRHEIEKIRYRKIVFPILIILSALAYYFISDSTISMLFFNCAVLVCGMSVGDRNILNSRPLKFLGSISFEMYLCHMMFITVLKKLNLMNVTSNDYINFAIVSLATLLGSIIFAYVGKMMLNYLIGLIARKREAIAV